MRQITKGHLWIVALVMLLSMALVAPAFAAEMPVLPMGVQGTVQNNDGTTITNGTVKVYIDGNAIEDVAISKDGKFTGFSAEVPRSAVGKAITFKIEVVGKEYAATSTPELKYQELGMVDNVVVKADEQINITAAGEPDDQDEPDNDSSTSGNGGGITAPAAPTANPKAGSYTNNVEVELATTSSQAEIYYTVDGTSPETSATKQEYSVKVKIEKDTTLKAVAYKNNKYSSVTVFDYKITTPDTPDTPAKPDVPDTTVEVNFNDLQGHWAAGVINELAGQGIINGYQDNTFKPNNLISRVECAAIIVRALDLTGGDVNAVNSFSDASEVPAWAKQIVASAVEENLLKGYPDTNGATKFLPNKQVTRVELAAIMERVLTQKLGAQQAAELSFKDKDNVPAWAKGAVAVVSQKGLVQGYPDGTFMPMKEVSRAEAAAMISRLLEAVGNN